MKSAHSDDMAKPCEGCGAIWQYTEGGRSWVMDHLDGCQYLEDLQYGSDREIHPDDDGE